MTKPDKQVQEMQQELELLLNEQGADVAIYRLLVQALFVTILDGHPHRDRLFKEVRAGVLQAVAQNQPRTHAPDGIGKLQELTLIRAETEFQKMAESLGISKADS